MSEPPVDLDAFRDFERAAHDRVAERARPYASPAALQFRWRSGSLPAPGGRDGCRDKTHSYQRAGHRLRGQRSERRGPVFLMHGWPYDPRTYDDVVPRLVAAGCRTIVPYLRGFGPTRFLHPNTPRSGEQAALGNDLGELMDALGIARAVLAGYDWGGRAACVVAALWPDRVRGLMSANGYNVHDVAASAKPASPEHEQRLWYQYYFHTERGRAGLTANRHAFCKFIWRSWSPTWQFDDAIFERTAASFDNPDFVDVVFLSYR